MDFDMEDVYRQCEITEANRYKLISTKEADILYDRKHRIYYKQFILPFTTKLKGDNDAA
jgi:hypothetical protein